MDHLAVELDRYRDVRVALRRTTERPLPLRGRRASRSPGSSWRRTASRGSPCISQDCRTDRQVWAEEYRGNPGQSGDFYRETAKVVAARIASEQGIVAQVLCGQALPAEMDGTTYGALLRSYRFFLTREPADLVPALEALRRAVAADPECALAWGQLSRLHVANHAFEFAPADTSIEQGLAFAQNAVRLDPSSQRARAALAFALLVKGETAAALAETENALALNPETFVYLEVIGWLLALLGEWERGTALVRRAIARNPHHLPHGYHALWADHLRRGEVEEASRTAALGGGGRSEAQLDGQVQPPAPGLLVVLLEREDEVQEVLAHAVPPVPEGHGHGQRDLVVVARPAAVQVELRRVLRLGEHAFDEVVLVREGAGHAGRVAEDLAGTPRP